MRLCTATTHAASTMRTVHRRVAHRTMATARTAHFRHDRCARRTTTRPPASAAILVVPLNLAASLQHNREQGQHVGARRRIMRAKPSGHAPG